MAPKYNKIALVVNIISVIIIGLLAAFLMAWGYINIYITSFLKHDSKDITTNQVNFLYSFTLIAQVPSYYSADPLVKRFGYSKALIISVFILS